MNAEKKEGMKGFSSLTVFSLFEKIIAFGFQTVIAAVLGAGLVTDCYYSASQLFDLVDATLLGALVVSLINRYTHISERDGEDEAFRFLSNINTWATLLMLLISAIVFVFAGAFSYLIAPGFEESVREELVSCIRVLTVIPIVSVLGSISQALLRQKKHYLIANSRSLFISLCGMVALLIIALTGDTENSKILCYAYIASNVLFSLATCFKARRYGKLSYCKPVPDTELKTVLKMITPTIISNGVLRVSLIIGQILSSMTGPGAITCLTYAQSLYNIVSSLLIINLGVVLLTEFTKSYVAGEIDALVARLRSSTASITLLLAPITALCVIFSTEIVTIIYQRGAFDAYDTQRVAGMLMFYALGFIPAMFNTAYTQVLYAHGMMKTAMRNSVISLSLNILLSLVLSQIIGLNGIAIGTAAAALIATFFFKHSVTKVVAEYTHIFETKFVLRMMASLAIGLVPAVAIKLFVDSALISFAAATICCFGLFFVRMFVLKDEIVTGYARKFLKIKR